MANLWYWNDPNVTFDNPNYFFDGSHVDNPPFAQRVPVVAKHPAQLYCNAPYYGDWLYGFVYQAGVYQTPRIDDPPFAQRVPVVVTDQHGDAQQYGFTFKGGRFGPPQVNNPAGFTFYGIYALRAAWPQDSWPAQQVSSVVQGYPGDEPPGYPVPPELADYPYDTWGAQSTTRLLAAAVNVPITPAVNNPPFGVRVPILSKGSDRCYYDDTLQYGFTIQGGVRPAPAVVSVNPSVSLSITYALRETWPQDNWGTQSLNGKLIQPSTGNQPPRFVPQNLALYRYETWAAQSTVQSPAALIPQPSAPQPMSLAGLVSVRATWSDATWGAQSAYNPVVALTLPYGQQPPVSSYASLYAVRSGWADAVWPSQTAAPQAPWAPSQPQVVSIGSSVSIRATWGPDAWSSQRLTSVAPLTLVYGQQPPAHTNAGLSALRATWAEQTWSAQRSVLLITLPPAVPPQVLGSFSSIREIWTETTWSVQRSAAPVFAGPTISVPPLYSLARFNAIRALWPDVTYGAQSAPQRQLPQPSNPPARSFPALLSVLRGTWPQDAWAAQVTAPEAAIIPPVNNPPPLSLGGAYAQRALWLPATWPAQSAFDPLGYLGQISSPAGLYSVDPSYIDYSSRRFRAYRFKEMGPSESRVLTFDFTSDLVNGEQLIGIISVVVTCTAGTDETPTDVLNGEPAFNSAYTQVLQPVTNGEIDSDYYFVVTAATTNPQKVLARYGYLPIRG